MNEVTKLYMNCNIAPTRYDACEFADKYWDDEVDKENDGFYSILQLFDIEEVNK